MNALAQKFYEHCMGNSVTALKAPVGDQDIREHLCEVVARHAAAAGSAAPTPKFIELLNNTVWAPPDLIRDCMRGLILSRTADQYMWRTVSELKGMSWPYFVGIMEEQGYGSEEIARTQRKVQSMILDLWDSSSGKALPNMTPFPNEKTILNAAQPKLSNDLEAGKTVENALEVWERFCSLPGFSWSYFESLLKQLDFEESQIKAVKRLTGKRLRLHQETGSHLELRSGYSADKAKRARQAVVDWTTGQYQSTQDFLRYGDTRKGANVHAALMAEYFKRMVATAPHGSKPGTQYLYRGVHAEMADALNRHGFLHEQGYLAFSWDKRVAERFAKGRLMLRLRVRDIPPGTPWVWFGAGSHPGSSAASESEVLLPPGRLLTAQPDSAEPDVLPVKYLPFK